MGETPPGWLYLAVVMDLYSRKIVGWRMGAQLTAAPVENALCMALNERQPDPGLLHNPIGASNMPVSKFANSWRTTRLPSA